MGAFRTNRFPNRTGIPAWPTSIGLLSVLACASAISAFASSSTLSGFILLSHDGDCQILWGSNVGGVTCQASVKPAAGVARVKLDYSLMGLSLPPVCDFSHAVATTGAGNPVLVSPSSGNFGNQSIDLWLESDKGNANFICSVPDDD